MSDSRPSSLWAFLMTRKKWWLTPIVIALLLLATLTLLDRRSAVAPFDYSTSTSE